MELTSKEALELLNQSKGIKSDDNWIMHSICVGNSAGKIAEALNLDVDYATTLGYIHDIGKKFPSNQSHVITGYEYILKLGYGDKYASVCLTHSYLNNDLNCKAGGTSNINTEEYQFKKAYIENHPYSIYEKIINLCDLICKEENITMEQRLIELISRYGIFENTQYHIIEALKLKRYFDDLLGYNLYDLFPEIKNNI